MNHTTKELIDTLLAISVVSQRLAKKLSREEKKMEPIMKVINALSALTAALQEMTEQTTDNYLNTFETIYDPEKDKPVAEEKPTPQTVDFIQLRKRLSEISRTGHTEEIKELLLKHGAEKLSEINESDYATVLAEAEALL